MNIGRFCLLLWTAILICAPSISRGITLGQTDTFENGTMLGWLSAGPALKNQFGGPAGPSDHYLFLIPPPPGESSPSAYWLLIGNGNQWSGNYISAGVTGIEMDLINPSTSDMPMRVGIEPPGGGLISSYGSTTGFGFGHGGSPARKVQFTVAAECWATEVLFPARASRSLRSGDVC